MALRVAMVYELTAIYGVPIAVAVAVAVAGNLERGMRQFNPISTTHNLLNYIANARDFTYILHTIYSIISIIYINLRAQNAYVFNAIFHFTIQHFSETPISLGLNAIYINYQKYAYMTFSPN
jgi:hypothetical protein